MSPRHLSGSRLGACVLVNQYKLPPNLIRSGLGTFSSLSVQITVHFWQKKAYFWEGVHLFRSTGYPGTLGSLSTQICVVSCPSQILPTFTVLFMAFFCTGMRLLCTEASARGKFLPFSTKSSPVPFRSTYITKKVTASLFPRVAPAAFPAPRVT